MEEELLYRVAYMYYVEEKSLEQISKELSKLHPTPPHPATRDTRGSPQYSPSAISKWLKRARETGMIRFVIDPPRLVQRQLQLLKAFKGRLKDALVVATPPVPADAPLHREQLGKAAADYVADRLSNGGHLGLCGGRTMAYFAQALRCERISQLDVHALAAASFEPIEYAASTIVGIAVLNLREGKPIADTRIRGHGTLLPVGQTLAKSGVYEKARCDIEQARKKCDIVVAGVGGLTRDSSCLLRTREQDLSQMVADLRRLRAVGDFLYQLFDDGCQPIRCDLNDQIVGLPLREVSSMVREGTLVIAVAGGPDKVAALRVLLNADPPAVSCLITDEATAQELCPA